MTRPDLQHDGWRFFVKAEESLNALTKLMHDASSYAARTASAPMPDALAREIEGRAADFRANFDKMRHSLAISALVQMPPKEGR